MTFIDLPWVWLSVAGLVLVWAAYGVAGRFAAFPLAFHFSWIVVRAIVAARAPFSDLFESLVFFGFLLNLKALVVARKTGRLSRLLLLAPGIAALLAALVIPGSGGVPLPVSAALRSPWILIHVPAAFYGYVSLTFALIGGMFMKAAGEASSSFMAAETKQAFFFLSLGIIAGAFWADASWGVFWSWDAKELWALATWFILGLALHTRNRRWRLLALGLAFAAMLFTFFGASYLLPGLHSYI